MEEVRSGIANLNLNISAVQLDTAAVRDRASAGQKAQLLNKICAVDYVLQHRDFIGMHQHGTGEWFLSDPKYQEWISSSDGTLFCPGVPGAGKTMMAALVIEQLHRNLRSDQQPVVFIYYNYKSQGEQTLLHTLSTFLRQIISALPGIPAPVEDLYRHAPSTEEVKSMLAGILATLDSLTIVTDALDECHERTRFDVLEYVEGLRVSNKVRLLATSRDFHATASCNILRNNLPLR